VGPGEAFQPSGEPDDLIDGTDCVLLPGLVNAHTHAAMTLFRGSADDMPLEPWLEQKIWPVEMKLRPADVYWATKLAIAEMLRAGVTCFNDMYHFPEAGARAAIDAGIRMCPSGVLLGFLPNAEDLLSEAIEFCREFEEAGGGRITPMLAPHAPYTCPRPMLERVIAAACGLGVPIHIHLAETQDNVQSALDSYGKRPIEAMQEIGLFQVFVSAPHCVHLSDAEIEIIARAPVGVAHCPGSNMKLSSGVAPVPELLAAGATVGLGTDGCASNNNLDLLEEARLAALLAKVNTGDPTALPAETALTLATRGSAEALSLADRIGTLEPGKRADCILIDLDQPHLYPRHNVVSHLIYAARAGDVRITIVDGEVLLRDGEFTRLDEREVIARTCESADRLF
jgi:5-methylthioadenosine/S-adenosylhomocysteine deaminase